MVRAHCFRLLFIFLLLIVQTKNSFAYGADVTVTSEMSDYNLTEGQPLKGTVTVTRDRNNPIDTSSFHIGNKPLTVDYIKDVRISENSPLTISIYNFELPSKPKGLYILDPISVKVGGQLYQSFKVSYQVNALPNLPEGNISPKAPEAATQPASSLEGAELKLEAKVIGPTTLYPAERTTLVYRFLYTGNIDLTKEVLPMLEAEGFKKIGDKQHQELQEGNYSVSQFSQEVEAITPGTYTYGPSLIEGTAYAENASQQKVYQKKLQSEAPAVVLTVLSAPEDKKPPSYNGAIGKFSYHVELASSNEVAVGDKIRLLIEVKGDSANLKTVKAKDLCCEPGFSGMFQASDLSPEESTKGNTKSFLIELRPLSEAVKEIPSIEFSSFNRETGKYEIERSAPIPIKVVSIRASQQDSSKRAFPSNQEPSLPPIDTFPSSVEITGIYLLVPSDLTNAFGGSLWTLLWIPIGAVFIYAQALVKKDWEQKKAKDPKNVAKALFERALKEKEGSRESFNLLREALLLALKEKGLIESTDLVLEKLPNSGLVGEVKSFITKVEELRFSGQQKPEIDLNDKAKELFNKINQLVP